MAARLATNVLGQNRSRVRRLLTGFQPVTNNLSDLNDTQIQQLERYFAAQLCIFCGKLSQWGRLNPTGIRRTAPRWLGMKAPTFAG